MISRRRRDRTGRFRATAPLCGPVRWSTSVRIALVGFSVHGDAPFVMTP